jgi:RHS repeat-associated protein
VRELSASNRQRALNAGGLSASLSEKLDTERSFVDDGLEMVEELGPLHTVKLPSGQTASARRRTTVAYDEGAPEGSDPHLPTTTTVQAAVDGGANDIDPRVTKTEYDWLLRKPLRTITDPSGLNLVHRTVYDSKTGLELESRMPRNPDGPADASTTKTTYYAATAPAGYDADCANKPEWANLPCKTAPAAQPGTPGLPGLPVTTYSYNRLGQTVSEAERVGTETRTTTTSYDSAGRVQSESIVSSVGEPVPAVTTGYSPTTGRATTLSAGGRTLTTGYDTLGRVTSYTDADGNTATTQYDLLGRPTVRSDGKGAQWYGYNATSGLLTGLLDSQAGAFSASYDPDGALVSGTYPNGMSVDTVFDETGAATDLTYTKTSNCSSNCVWVEDHVSESIHGQWVERQSKLSSQQYAYDQAGRLTLVKDTPTGQGCTTRAYGFDADSNRTARTTRTPGAGGACDTSSSGQVQASSYDAADRTTNSGFVYDAFGRTTTIPASHSGGGALTTSYYANDMVRTQAQDGASTGWLLDVLQSRQRASIPNGPNQEILHYKDGSDAPAWSAQTTGGTETSWSRNIEGIAGDLAATYDSQTATTTLQLANLHGDIVATASTSTTAGGPTATFESDEYGNPRTPSSRRYQWLGAKQRRTVLASGTIQMGVRSYIPAIGRFTSVDPVAGGSANDYDYTNADPINGSDVDGHQAVGWESVHWDIHRHHATMTHTFPLGRRAKVIVHANINMDGRNVTVNFSARAIGRSLSVQGVDIYCREEHFPLDNGCGHEPGVTAASRTVRLNDDANYHFDLKFHVWTGKASGHFNGSSPHFSCKKRRKRGACRFN